MAELKMNTTLLLKYIYPIGSIYMSVKSTSPATFIGGTWERIQGRFLWGADTTITPGQEGGEQNHILTVDEMPKHRHEQHVTVGNGSISGMRNDYQGEGNTNAYPQGISTMSSGKDQPHNNMPPYLSVYIWKRTA